MTRFKNFLESKTFFVIASILLAIMTWFLVLNTTNPTETRLVEIPLNIQNPNAPASLGLSERDSDIPEKISVKVSGRADIIGNLTTSDLKAAIDFKNVKGSGITTLKIEEPECSRLGISIIDYYPKSVNVKFNKVTQKNLDVQIEYDNSLLSDGFEFISVVGEPESIQISGFETDIEQIDCIKVFLDESLSEKSIDSDKTGSFLGHYMLKSGEDATAKYTAENIYVKIQVAKRVPVVYELSGSPDKDFYIVSHSVSNNSVLLRGPAASLKKINEINLGSISVSDITTDIEKKFNLKDYLPTDVEAYQLEEVDVSIKTAKYETCTIELSKDDLNRAGVDKDKYDCNIISPDEFDIVIKGKAEDLNELTAASLGATISLNDDVGIFPNVEIEFRGLNERFTVVGHYYCAVEITERQSDIQGDNDVTDNLG